MYFDIGANVGKWTLSNLNAAQKIISIEADPDTFATLKNASDDPRIIPLNFAVCSTTDENIVFYKASGSTLSTLNKNWLSDTSSRFYNVSFIEIICKTITIDKLIELYGMPDLIKIDVEGGEYMCISSLNQKVPLLCFEWASETNDITNQCLDHLISLGFTDFFLQTEDAYTFRPPPDEYLSVDVIREMLLTKIPKLDWGMIWCK
jgi:FkbM family methyltransferase